MAGSEKPIKRPEKNPSGKENEVIPTFNNKLLHLIKSCCTKNMIKNKILQFIKKLVIKIC